jgi:hypothetical protein
VSIYGGNAETDLLASVVGQFVDKFEPRAAIAAWRSSSVPHLRGLAAKSKQHPTGRIQQLELELGPKTVMARDVPSRWAALHLGTIS